jgi:hypothetical protein
MKIYAIEYQRDIVDEGEILRFFIVTCKFLSTRKEIDLDFFDELKMTFQIAGKNNNSRSGIYFDCI